MLIVLFAHLWLWYLYLIRKYNHMHPLSSPVQPSPRRMHRYHWLHFYLPRHLNLPGLLFSALRIHTGWQYLRVSWRCDDQWYLQCGSWLYFALCHQWSSRLSFLQCYTGFWFFTYEWDLQLSEVLRTKKWKLQLNMRRWSLSRKVGVWWR